ncbi:MAG: hypothetical protein ACM3UR_06230 [Bacteroidota bacterium]|jgi:hypothetical protein
MTKNIKITKYNFEFAIKTYFSKIRTSFFYVGAPEYRGSTGYGNSFYEKIDYGGLIALMDIFQHPDDYKAAFAGVPVSDLVARTDTSSFYGT